ncbi:hypothetical protein J6TS1_16870 [Siminovitchia terrae]|uniref:SAF domain-containing protein n=1 Tax=Siminovitchia terrae TaxID=1914933 RepID=A0ABQ4KVU2_SIMTE|nr:UxaA family hydrolase [Siminovitchia terrae]GIN93008.1 hypothetical protein J22TS1_40590 [Siminovitchia terrae]GIN95817.1 hypothetical protein J6TS1_16870 [Siminovitchia terrae]
MEHSILIHKPEDHVGVAVRDIDSGETVVGLITENNDLYEVKVIHKIPLGHKVALKSVSDGEPILIYGSNCGLALDAISKGEHVHVHNMVSARWK